MTDGWVIDVPFLAATWEPGHSEPDRPYLHLPHWPVDFLSLRLDSTMGQFGRAGFGLTQSSCHLLPGWRCQSPARWG